MTKAPLAKTMLTKSRLTMAAAALALCLVVSGGVAGAAQADHSEHLQLEFAISQLGDSSPAKNSGDTGDAVASTTASR